LLVISITDAREVVAELLDAVKVKVFPLVTAVVNHPCPLGSTTGVQLPPPAMVTVAVSVSPSADIVWFDGLTDDVVAGDQLPRVSQPVLVPSARTTRL
jgi:hypothetical protein